MRILADAFGKQQRWLVWKYETNKGKKTKVPYRPSGRKASSTNEKDWVTYLEAASAANGGKFDGVGIVFTSSQTLLGIDIDHCLKDGVVVHEQKETIEKLIATADTYTEISPSKEGLHLLLQLTEPFEVKGNKRAPYELYTKDRYFTVTNTPFGDARPVRAVEHTELLKILSIIGHPWTEEPSKKPMPTPSSGFLTDEQVIKKMLGSKNGVAITKLWNGDISEYSNDESSADMALASHLAFWCGKNKQQMERIWLLSPLGQREKTQQRIDYRSRTLDFAIKNCKETYTPSRQRNEKEERKSTAEVLLEHIETLGALLFKDQQGDAYIAIPADGHHEIWPCNSKAIRRRLALEYWKLAKNAPTTEAIKNVIGVLEGRASFEGPQYRLEIRSAWHGEELWYDPTDESWRAIRVTSEGWQLVDNPPILFKRYSHNRPQVTPISGGDIRLFLNYVNVKDEQQKLLLLVFLVSCFIPDIAHVILVVFGAQGSAKSTLSKMLRKVIDPSAIEVASMPETHKELVQTLAHHAFLFFDNVSYISESTSDILCKAVTGSGFPKRELYSDDEDIIYNFKRCIGINGINLVSTRPDLLERSLLLGLERIDPRDRKQEKEMAESFSKDLPLILGGVFDALVKALHIKQTVILTNTPRMADFAVWGCAIAEALGFSQKEFLAAYRHNIDQQTEVSLNENIVAAAVVSFMADKETWKGTASELLQLLRQFVASDGFDVFEKYWPRASNVLMRRLNELSVNLKAVGISVVSVPGTTREVVITKKVADDADGNS